MKLRDYLLIADLAIIDIDDLPRPDKLCGKKTPSDLNRINMGQLMQLMAIKTPYDVLTVPAKVLLGIEEKKLMKAEACKVIGFSVWASKEVARISKMFSKTNVPPTPEEEQAGAGRMNFGMFGMLDYYARRMGVTDHEEVERVPWIRVYKCLDMDAKVQRYQRRLREILNKKHK